MLEFKCLVCGKELLTEEECERTEAALEAGENPDCCAKCVPLYPRFRQLSDERRNAVVERMRLQDAVLAVIRDDAVGGEERERMMTNLWNVVGGSYHEIRDEVRFRSLMAKQYGIVTAACQLFRDNGRPSDEALEYVHQKCAELKEFYGDGMNPLTKSGDDVIRELVKTSSLERQNDVC